MALPAHAPGRMPVGLCVYGMTYLIGITWAGTERANPRPLTAEQVFALAAEARLSHVEMPLTMLESTGKSLPQLRAEAEGQGLGFVVPAGPVGVEELTRHLHAAEQLGAPVVRCILSRLLCGDRRGFAGGWKAHLSACADALEQVVPLAERLGVAIGVENHQDADSADLLALCRRFESRYLGVTLDAGNPLSVMEEPLEFAGRLAPYLRHVHLKDYRVYPAPNGFRLVRCALGDGVIDFPALFELLDAQEWPVTRSLEVGALQARQIPMLEESWWGEFEGRTLQGSLPALRLVWNRMGPTYEDWRTPFECDATGQDLADYEWGQYHDSIEWLTNHR